MDTGLVSELLEFNDTGDDAVDYVLSMADNGDIDSLHIVEAALAHFSTKKLVFFTPGPRVLSGDDVYGSKAYNNLENLLIRKAKRKLLLENAADTQDEIIRLTGHVDFEAGTFFKNIRMEGGWEALKIVQLLDTHTKVQARLINNGVLPRRA